MIQKKWKNQIEHTFGNIELIIPKVNFIFGDPNLKIKSFNGIKKLRKNDIILKFNIVEFYPLHETFSFVADEDLYFTYFVNANFILKISNLRFRNQFYT